MFLKNSELLTFPCNDHKTEIMTNIFQYYITMRMKQFTLSQNKQLKKKIYKKKKLSKLITISITNYNYNSCYILI